jgi:hypothetical protein
MFKCEIFSQYDSGERCGPWASCLQLSPLKLEKIKHGFKTLAECGGICGVDNTSSFKIMVIKGQMGQQLGKTYLPKFILEKFFSKTSRLISIKLQLGA